ncbi:MAG: TraI domain-containing protein [Candidatus Accumulibacter sp.]|jgi:integrating conjugative element relaxase (TIGR03760 family)|nr:TraI domain-containing protein [Accumulibacter sp.]
MFSLFQRKRVPIDPPDSVELPQGMIRPESAVSLLSPPRRQKLLEAIWQRTSLSRAQFSLLYQHPLERYAELAQAFPASENHHHAYPGGLLDHGLEIVVCALKLRQAHLLPVGATPEEQAAQSEAWTAAVAYAALLHDIGKIAVDLHVELSDASLWHPWHGPIALPYRFRYRREREYRLHNAAAGLLYHRLLTPDILDWLSRYPAPWSALLYVLAGQYEHAGTLGELVIQADRASVAQSLGGDPSRALAAPQHSLQRKLLEGLRYLLKETLKLNQPQASDGWLTQDALWLVSKTVSDRLRAHLLSQGIEGIPASNTALFDRLQDHGFLLPTPDGKAIWKATVTSDTGWRNAFTFLKVSPALIWETGEERPAPFAGMVDVVVGEESGSEETLATVPTAEISSNVSDMDRLLEMFDAPSDREMPEMTEAVPQAIPDTAIAEPEHAPPSSNTPQEPSGEHFIAWLRQRIASHVLIINDAKALVHTVADTVYLVSPGIFQRYAQEHPKLALLAKEDKLSDWQWIQKRFEKLALHRKQENGLNLWHCEVAGPRKTHRLHGYLLKDPKCLFDDVPPNNPHLALVLGTSPA